MDYSICFTAGRDKRRFFVALLTISFTYSACAITPRQETFAAADIPSSKSEIANDIARGKAYLEGNGVRQDLDIR